MEIPLHCVDDYYSIYIFSDSKEQIFILLILINFPLVE